jgi:GMP synthase (glutamine-hydrolysing)
MARVIVLRHYGCETVGAIGDALRRSAIHWDYVSLAESAAVMPDAGTADGLVVLGGPFSVYLPERYPWVRSEMEIIRKALSRGVPILGICLGSQLLAAALGSRVRAASQVEIGWLPVHLELAARDDRLFHDLPESFITCVWHGDVFDLPAGAVSLARSRMTSCQAYRCGTQVYGLLFHLEMKQEMVATCVRAFEPRLRLAGIDPASCVTEAARHAAAAAPLAEAVFDRWCELVRSGRRERMDQRRARKTK